jgi:hypothetical protein
LEPLRALEEWAVANMSEVVGHQREYESLLSR